MILCPELQDVGRIELARVLTTLSTKVSSLTFEVQSNLNLVLIAKSDKHSALYVFSYPHVK